MTNVDEKEIQKFDAMSAHWWDLNGPCKPLHDLNPVRLAFIQSCCSLHQQPILDVGCGGGILTESLSHFSSKVIGLDQAEQALTVAKTHAQNLPQPPAYVLSTAEDYAQTHPGEFSVVTCMELLEHVPSPQSTLSALADLLKPGGDLFISTLNRTPKAFLQAIVGAEYILRMLPWGTHEYKRFIRPSELAAWVKPLQLKVKQISGIRYHLLNQTFSLSKDVSVNYLMHLKKEA